MRLLFVFFLLAAPAIAAEKPLKVVATIGQITDVVANVGGQHLSVEGLMGAGVDPHLYRASAGDVDKLSRADIIFYNGLHLEAKMGEIFENMGRARPVVAVSGDIAAERLLSDQKYPDIHDPHIWFDVSLWMDTVVKVRETLSKLDPSGKEEYAANAQRYLDALKDLDTYVSTRAAELQPSQRVLVTAHDAFRYFGRRYGFVVIGLQGISTEAEAGAKDVANLADLIVNRKVKAIFIESSVPERNIKAVQEAVRARGWDVKIGGELFSDALGSAGTKEGTYIGMVEHNINTIVDALK